jgi:hypothetical protein
MYLKLMTGRGEYRFVEVTECAFRRLPEPMVIYRQVGALKDEAVPLNNNAFLLSAYGDTIEAFFIKDHRYG